MSCELDFVKTKIFKLKYLSTVLDWQRGSRVDLWTTAVRFQSANARHQHNAIRLQVRVTALYIKELLHANVSAEARFSHNETILSYQLQRDLVGDD
jgi:hypothetical protein